MSLLKDLCQAFSRRTHLSDAQMPYAIFHTIKFNIIHLLDQGADGDEHWHCDNGNCTYLLCMFPCYSYNTVTLTLTNVIWRMIGLTLT